MQVLALRNIVFFLTVCIYKGTGASRFLVKPVSDVCPCCLNHRFDLWQVSVFLDEGSQIVDVVKKGYPDIVWTVVLLQLRQDVVSALFVLFGKQFFQIVCCTLFTHLKLEINQYKEQTKAFCLAFFRVSIIDSSVFSS